MNKKIVWVWIIAFIVSIFILILVGIPKLKTKTKVIQWPTIVQLQKQTQEINKEVSWVRETLENLKSKVNNLEKQCNQVKSWLQKSFNLVDKPEIKSCEELNQYKSLLKNFYIEKNEKIKKIRNQKIIEY